MFRFHMYLDDPFVLGVAEKHLFGYLEDWPWTLDGRYHDVYEGILGKRELFLIMLFLVPW